MRSLRKSERKRKKIKEEGEGGQKRKRCFLLPPYLEMLATKLFLVMTWDCNNSEVGIGLTRSLSSLFG